MALCRESIAGKGSLGLRASHVPDSRSRLTKPIEMTPSSVPLQTLDSVTIPLQNGLATTARRTLVTLVLINPQGTPIYCFPPPQQPISYFYRKFIVTVRSVDPEKSGNRCGNAVSVASIRMTPLVFRQHFGQTRANTYSSFSSFRGGCQHEPLDL